VKPIPEVSDKSRKCRRVDIYSPASAPLRVGNLS
jgi:hypothetical protein